MKAALIDTSAIYALVDKRDKWHGQAKRQAHAWLTGGGHWLLPDFIFDEAMTLVKARINAHTAIGTGERLRRAAAYHWLTQTTEDEQQAREIFKRYHDKPWSYTDCALFALALRLNVPVYTFDLHFRQMPGVERVP
jgi:predicted nucleic acid-binding protein